MLGASRKACKGRIRGEGGGGTKLDLRHMQKPYKCRVSRIMIFLGLNILFAGIDILSQHQIDIFNLVGNFSIFAILNINL